MGGLKTASSASVGVCPDASAFNSVLCKEESNALHHDLLLGKMRNSMSGQTEKISEVAPGIFRIVVQIPIPGVGFMNSYVIVDGDRNLIVDPGMAHPECYEQMEKSIENLGVDLGRTDFGFVLERRR
jgi:hypothetical protein